MKLEGLTPAQRRWLGERLGVAVEDDAGEGALVAFVRVGGIATDSHALDSFTTDAKSTTDVDGEALRAFLAKRLPGHMVPSCVVGVGEWPVLPNGKTDRKALAASLEASDAGRGLSAIPKEELDSVERELLATWREVLGRSDLGPEDNFFEWGGHSLQVIRIIGAMEPRVGRIAVADFFQRPTVRELAGFLRGRETVAVVDAAGLDQVFPIQRDGGRRPLFVVQPAMFSEALAEWFRGERPVYGVRGIAYRPDLNGGRWACLEDLAVEIAGEIRRVQPEGAVLLAGFSLGGVIAHEVARVMEARGDAVGRLVLFEPTPWNVVPVGGGLRVQLRRNPELVAGLSRVRALGLWLQESHPFCREFYRRLARICVVSPWRRLMQRRARRVVERGRVPGNGAIKADTHRERFRLFFEHRPGEVSADTVFFKSAEAAFDNGVMWQTYFDGRFEVRELPGGHFDLLASEEGRRVIRGALAEALA